MSVKDKFLDFFTVLNAKEQEEVLEVAQMLTGLIKNGLRLVKEESIPMSIEEYDYEDEYNNIDMDF